MVFLRFILIILLIYLAFKLFARYVFPWLMKRFIERLTGNNVHQKQYGDKNTKKKEGEITVDYIPGKKPKKKIDDEEGEYVNYEELD